MSTAPARPTPSPGGLTAPPRMIATDLDGTLLDADGRVSRRNADALRRAEEAGVRVVVATGRPIWWLQPVLDTGFTGTAVCLNGAVVFDVGRRDIVGTSPLTTTVMTDFVRALDARTGRTALAVERLGVDAGSCWAERSYDHPWGDAEFQLTDRDDLLSEPAAKLLIRLGHDSRALAVAAREVAGDDVHVTYSSDDGLIEVAAAGVNKGATLSRLAGQWGISAAETIVFGDMPNDLEMLAWAAHGVAMGNAHPDVHAVADEVAPEHHEDGVAQVLERWF
ncbi:HAD family phosphatase [Nakamurella flavida]|uniref:HAD family phosphatase n=1 Tax=Nakamurella flavida TaxID=363630 RepID=A0A938YQY4_9ACTN|nr:HAD family hydrolase [Nakamurella flavida]MBM9477822.1 HAD family phosphatase [Nakamurella flavida]MDP9779376.1 Cof subfamily protein (haloacid dehalogenase superfamily) [Nakamurella flavida]